MDKLNVLWIIPHLDRRLLELASNLGALGIGIHVAAQNGTPYLLPGIDKPRGADPVHSHSTRSLRAHARQLLESSGARLVHAAGLGAVRIATGMARRNRGLRVIAEYDGGAIPAWCRTPRTGFAHPLVEQVLLREPHHLAHFQRRTGIKAGRIHTIPFGIRSEWFERPGMQCWAREDTARLFVMGVSLEQMSNRNLRLVLAACNLLLPDANVRLLLIDRADRCDEVIQELHRWPESVVAKTHIVIDKSDPGMFWSVCTSSLHFPGEHSSLNELRDSMASAVTPIVVPQDGDQIVEDLSTGLVVSVPNPHSLCQAIQYLRNDLAACRDMALKARESVLASGSFEAATTALAAIYRRTSSERDRQVQSRPAPEQTRHQISV